ncbi:MAG: hypothetical protein FJ014_17795 [Chloroflexi bacterium]|nr:hypothetical protein [Chloroflexota bacterium]
MSYITRDFPIEFVNAIVHKEVQGKKPINTPLVGSVFRVLTNQTHHCSVLKKQFKMLNGRKPPPALTVQVAFLLLQKGVKCGNYTFHGHKVSLAIERGKADLQLCLQ